MESFCWGETLWLSVEVRSSDDSGEVAGVRDETGDEQLPQGVVDVRGVIQALMKSGAGLNEGDGGVPADQVVDAIKTRLVAGEVKEVRLNASLDDDGGLSGDLIRGQSFLKRVCGLVGEYRARTGKRIEVVLEFDPDDHGHPIVIKNKTFWRDWRKLMPKEWRIMFGACMW